MNIVVSSGKGVEGVGRRGREETVIRHWRK